MADTNIQSELTNEALEKVLKWVEASEAFVVEQAPLVVQEIILFGRVRAAITMVICVIIVAALIANSIYASRKAAKLMPEEDADDPFTRGVAYAFSALISGLSLLPVSAFILSGWPMWMKPFVAPRLYVIQQIAEMIR